MHSEKIIFGRDELVIETGKLAKLADGSVTVRQGGTVVLATAVCSKTAREDCDFFPLTVEYQERTFAAGKIPGGFFKREGRPSEKAVLTSRMIDRPIRPLFPEKMMNEVQIVATVLSLDDEHDSDVLALIGASAAITISDIPFNGPIGAARVGLLDGKLILNPTFGEVEKSELDLVVVANEEKVIMLECGASQLAEEKIIEAIRFGHDGLKPQIEMQRKLQKKAGLPKREDITYVQENEGLYGRLRSGAVSKLGEILLIADKQQRIDAFEKLEKEIIKKEVTEESGISEPDVRSALFNIQKEMVREMILSDGRRPDGRTFDQIRPLSSEVNVLPRTHGSALFTRGETQALAVTTLGTGSDEQIIDALEGESKRTFMLHYNFPPFSVGETKPMRGPGRREIGHGALAAKALERIMPQKEQFPYTVRIVSEILESNGSSSMATVCASSLSLMAGGVPVRAAVAGIAVGLIEEPGKRLVLTDIAGMEDHCGDMDFKVAGTRDGVTAVQLDVKIAGIDYDIISEAFEKAKKGRMIVLDHMAGVIAEPKKEISENAPRMVILKIETEKIREVIGPGGKVIRKIIAETGADINIEDDGSCQVASVDKASLDAAVKMIKDIVAEPELGMVYDGKITRIMAFGAFCEFMPGREGLIHVSEISDEYVKDVRSRLKEGDAVKVILYEIDDQGRNNLSIKRLNKGAGPSLEEGQNKNKTKRRRS